MSSSLCVPSVGGLCISTDLSRIGSYTVALLGDERVGKTSIMRRMSGARCPEEYVPTVDENITQNFTLGGKKFISFEQTSRDSSRHFPEPSQFFATSMRLLYFGPAYRLGIGYTAFVASLQFFYFLKFSSQITCISASFDNPYLKTNV